MKPTTRVDLHCHSVYSDGNLSPREIAEMLSADGVTVAALADHDSVDGLKEFGKTLARREVAHITGVEITTLCNGEEAHLLAYGFDPDHPELLAALHSLRQARVSDVQSVADAIRRKGSHSPGKTTSTNGGHINIADAIALVHRANGRAFLAHPLQFEPDFSKLEYLLINLKVQGLDGIEAIYGQYSKEQRDKLCDMARKLGLLVSAGTDIHDRKSDNSNSSGIDMPTELWKQFRDGVCCGSSSVAQPVASASRARAKRRFHWRHFIFNFIFPSMLAVALFITAIYAVILPTFEKSLLDRKREMIRELTNSAWSILQSYERDEREGRLTREQAQSMAIAKIELLRYGSERKDYFWLQDMHPRIIMHPYRSDLNNKDVSNFRDARGVRIFEEFAQLVEDGREGYVSYVWQWNDDPSRLVPKESYIKGFKPWGWIIGTGIYVEDVKQEIRNIERSLVRTSLGISLIVALLLLYVVRQSLTLERDRAEAEESLYDSRERYRSLVEATTEGILLIANARCRYANPIFLEMIGATAKELELLDLSDIFPRTEENETAWATLDSLLNNREANENFDAVLRRRDGTLVDCVISTNPIAYGGRDGFILLARSISPTYKNEQGDKRDHRWRYLQQIVEGIPVGLFRAKTSSRGTLIEYNQAAAQMLRTSDAPTDAPITLADVFHDDAMYAEFLRELKHRGKATYKVHITSKDLTPRLVAIAAVLASDENGSPSYIDGVVEDVTLQQQRIHELESVIEKLQTSMLFLHEPISQIRRSAVFCRLDTPISTVAAMMTSSGSSAAFVKSEKDVVVGVVTDSDMRERVVAMNIEPSEQVHRIMSSPLVTIPENDEIYSALMLMERKGVQHLAVTDESGSIIGGICHKELLQFESYGPIVLTREVQQASTPEEVVQCCKRVPDLAKALLDSGANPHHVTRMISSVCDAATVSLIGLAEYRLGPAPVPYVFLALGSHGRQEMTFNSDQDNAIIYEDIADPKVQLQAESYFTELGGFVCKWLEKAGYPLCAGNVMAQNPKWCKPLSFWKKYFTNWISLPEPQQLLDFAIFFDFRAVYGTDELARKLRRHVSAELQSQPIFYPHLAQNALLFRPPTRLFGRILTGGAGGEYPGLIDLKEAMMPIVNFARLYALKMEMDESHTPTRLNALIEENILQESNVQELISTYDFLMRIRLQHQAEMLSANFPIDNNLNYRRLSQMEQALLNSSFSQIAAMQKRISYDFLGGTQ